MKFTVEGGVRISVGTTDDALIQLTVSDSGIGIAPEDFPACSNGFIVSRARAAVRERAQGSGSRSYTELVKGVTGVLSASKASLGGDPHSS